MINEQAPFPPLERKAGNRARREKRHHFQVTNAKEENGESSYMIKEGMNFQSQKDRGKRDVVVTDKNRQKF